MKTVRCCYFLPGVGEIQRVHEHLASRVGSDVLLCPLYGALSLEAQRKAIVPAPAGMRKVVLATNIAETSLTIEGIRLVVDSAQERVARFDARTGLTRLVTQRISQASNDAARGARRTTGAGYLFTSAGQRTGGAGGGAKRSGNLTQRPFRFIDGGVAVGMSRSGIAFLAWTGRRR